MSLYFRTFYSLLSSPMINVVTIPSDVTNVTVWQITSNPNPRVLKIEKCKIIKIKIKIKIKSIVLYSYRTARQICTIELILGSTH